MNGIRCVVQTRDTLGECPVWHPEEQSLYWVDIEQQVLRRYNPAEGDQRCWGFPERISAFAFRETAEVVVALESGLYLYGLESGSLTVLATPEPEAGTRFNDGKCDRMGRFWAGTMDPDCRASIGSLYCLDGNLTCRRAVGGLGIPNGLAWSPDDTILYYADSLERVIYACDFDLGTGTIANPRVFSSTAGLPGLPDGSTVDEEGFLWNAQCNGWRLVRYSPDGRVDRMVELPVQYPTSCTFGGPGGKTLYVTSAVWDLNEEQLCEQPFAGGVLALEPGVAGRCEFPFSGSPETQR